jgi:hypothetical protein
MVNSQNDVVNFSNPATGASTLDVALANPIQSLEITFWFDTLTLNKDLTVTGPNGDFVLSDSSTITLGPNVNLTLLDLGTGPRVPGNNKWTAGTITGDSTATFTLTGTPLETGLPGAPAAPAGLGVTMVIQRSEATLNSGFFTLQNMTNNLPLLGAANYFDLKKDGVLNLDQHIAAAGQQNTVGGIALAAAHTGTLAVKVEPKGGLYREDTADPMVQAPDQVSIAGAVYNQGGVVIVWTGGSSLNITGKDVDGVSYIQTAGASALLRIDSGSNITAAGTYEIDSGEALLTAPSGGSADELDGLGLTFGNINNNSLTILDSGATTGTVTIQGPVRLAATTTTTLNFFGANNTADLLDVKNGTLTLAGKLSLVSQDQRKPTRALNFLDDTGLGASIAGDFATIVDNVNGTDTGAKVMNNPQQWYYAVTIT